MANFASLRGPVGMNRVFVRSGSPLEYRRWLTALKAGRSFATNGPLLGFTLGEAGLGDELKLPAGEQSLVARVTLLSNVPVDRLELVRNGEVATEIPLTGTRTRLSTRITVPVKESGWYLLRARGERSSYPILDVYPYATTSPIYVIVGDKPIRSSRDADYFIAWIDRLHSAAAAHTEWNTDAERRSTLDLIRRARDEFLRRSGT
jgi:TolB protein